MVVARLVASADIRSCPARPDWPADGSCSWHPRLRGTRIPPVGEGCVTPEIQMLHDAPVTSDHLLQHRTPIIGTMYVARPQHTPLDIAELVEPEERVIAGAAEMPIVGAAFLFAIEPAPAQAGVGLSFESMSSMTIFGPRRRRTLSIH